MKIKDIIIRLLIVIFIILFVKMCAITAQHEKDREPLREIDNWR